VEKRHESPPIKNPLSGVRCSIFCPPELRGLSMSEGTSQHSMHCALLVMHGPSVVLCKSVLSLPRLAYLEPSGRWPWFLRIGTRRSLQAGLTQWYLAESSPRCSGRRLGSIINY